MSLFGDHPYGDTTLGGGGIASGSTDYSLPLFNPSVGPAFTIPLQGRRRVHRIDTGKGNPKVQPLGIRARWGAELTWPSITTLELEEILSFFHDLEPSGGPFFWTAPWSLWSPTGSTPKLEGYSAGAASERTLDVAYTWYSSVTLGESRPSRTGTVVISASYRLQFTAPIFPNAVDKVRVYAATTGGTLKLQETSGERVWQEGAGGITTGGATVPSTSTSTGFGRYYLVDDYNPQFVRADRWALRLNFEEDAVPV